MHEDSSVFEEYRVGKSESVEVAGKSPANDRECQEGGGVHRGLGRVQHIAAKRSRQKNASFSLRGVTSWVTTKDMVGALREEPLPGCKQSGCLGNL
jgi:hypothetical protein